MHRQVLTTRSNDASGNASEATSPTRHDDRILMRSSPRPALARALGHRAIEVEGWSTQVSWPETLALERVRGSGGAASA